jgi:hypothetical protein
LACGESTSGPDGGGDTGGDPPASVEVSVTEPADGGEFAEGTAVRLAASVDPVGFDSVVWRSSRDGRLGTGATIVADGLSPGRHVIEALAYLQDASDHSQVSVKVLTPPDLLLLRPMDAWGYPPSATVELAAEAEDRDGGDVSLTWSSSLDGELGTGTDLETTLSLGDHTIRVVAVDDEGQAATSSVDVTVRDFTPDYALSFDGVDDGASTPATPDLDLAKTWTIELWVRPSDASAAGEQHLVSKWGFRLDRQSFKISIDNEPLVTRALYVSTFDGAQGRGVARGEVFTDDEWTHIAVVYQGGSLYLYKNGTLIDSSPQFSMPQATFSPLSIGRFNRDDGQPDDLFRGELDEVRVWNVARTAEQVRNNMNLRLSGHETGLVAYWTMREGDGDLASDATGGGHDLMLGGAPFPDHADPAWTFPGKDVD